MKSRKMHITKSKNVSAWPKNTKAQKSRANEKHDGHCVAQQSSNEWKTGQKGSPDTAKNGREVRDELSISRPPVWRIESPNRRLDDTAIREMARLLLTLDVEKGTDNTETEKATDSQKGDES